MRKLLIAGLCLVPTFAFAKFVNPMEFDGSDSQKEEVIQFITKNVHRMYCEGVIDACQESTLRMMERQELSSFIEATEATDKKIMKQAVKTYCEGPINMCSYSTVLMMYRANVQAAKQKLEW